METILSKNFEVEERREDQMKVSYFICFLFVLYEKNIRIYVHKREGNQGREKIHSKEK